MNIKKCVLKYFIVSIVFPIAIYLTGFYGNSMLKELTSIVFILYAIIIFFYSINVIRYVFGNRGHEILDKGFVLRINLAVIIMYMGRFIAVSLLKIDEIPNGLISVIIMPFSFMIIIPFIKNYCINKKTVYVTLIVAVILIYLIMPVCFKFVEDNMGDKIILLSNIYNKYFIYESFSNQWIMSLLNIIKLDVSDTVLLILLNVSKVAMFCIVFLPYFIINFVLIDELTYREMCTDMSKRKIVMLVFVMIVGVLVCVNMTNQGSIELLYNLKH